MNSARMKAYPYAFTLGDLDHITVDLQLNNNIDLATKKGVDVGVVEVVLKGVEEAGVDELVVVVIVVVVGGVRQAAAVTESIEGVDVVEVHHRRRGSVLLHLVLQLVQEVSLHLLHHQRSDSLCGRSLSNFLRGDCRLFLSARRLYRHNTVPTAECALIFKKSLNNINKFSFSFHLFSPSVNVASPRVFKVAAVCRTSDAGDRCIGHAILSDFAPSARCKGSSVRTMSEVYFYPKARRSQPSHTPLMRVRAVTTPVSSPALTTKKRVFTFGKGRSEGNKSMKSLLGGKGANLAEMASIGLSVPPGLTISTEACQEYQQNGKQLPGDLWDEVL
ncbi:Pyruvate, phosphate dikinase, chloroplastic-like protein [Drosera capensis]